MNRYIPDDRPWGGATLLDPQAMVTLPSEGKGHTFESCRVRQFLFIFQRDTRVQTKNRILSCSSE